MGYSDIKEMFIDAKNLASGANDLQLKSILLDIQGKVYELQEENRELRNQINDLKQADIIKSDLIWSGNVYFYHGDGPYCTNCMDSDSKLIRTALSRINYSEYAKAECPRCDNVVRTAIKVTDKTEEIDKKIKQYIKDLS
ncbi:hypothetical protein IHQ33_05540 [Enterococcus faecalis]|uniref:hypothetical protein n=1 Tax=Enterococcus faecalis TaxID=1351 RepID=UPI00177FE612|nr:hypothetical protein [Enterococcus faecalis]EKJ5004583.1 hypothetical protein [Enterococcus faecalis]EKO5667119.1 hypothetical protein [Enterococcus faecalis]EME3230501.1 hypothetical protein [Enterococcus faecalis]MBD9945036.1 hypothetical protein [Enterococcus faecalis]MBD9950322.1 hypothetical protein [Enterococcus faecalis]